MNLTLEEILTITNLDRIHIEVLRLTAKQSNEERLSRDLSVSAPLRNEYRMAARETEKELDAVLRHQKFIQEQTKLFND